MRRCMLPLLLALLSGCAGPQNSTPTTGSSPGVPAAPAKVSCQPFGYEPVLITFAYPIGPTTEKGAEQTAVGMLRACAATPDESGISVTIRDLTSGVKAATGGPKSPNAGQPVWEVKIDTMESIKGGAAHSAHYWIEVNQATGIPTMIAYG